MKVTRKELREVISKMISEVRFGSADMHVGAPDGDLPSVVPQTSRDPMEYVDASKNPNATWRNGSGRSRNIESLNPSAQQKLREFFTSLNNAGISVQITSAHRYPSHQHRLRYADSNPNATTPCRSAHQFGYAVDINIAYWRFPDDGGESERIVATKRGTHSGPEYWAPAEKIAKDMGIRWGGDFENNYDPVHFATRYHTTSQKNRCEDFYEDRIDPPEDPDTGAQVDLELEDSDDWAAIPGGHETLSATEEEDRETIKSILGLV
jgi:hypothetical protein